MTEDLPIPAGPLPADAPSGRLGSLDPRERRTARLCLSVLGVLSALSLLGVAFSLYLVNHFPLLLLALSPLGRHMWLVAPAVNPMAFVGVLVTRRMLFYGASFQLGRAVGPLGLVWLDARAQGFARYVRWLERLFARYSRIVVFSMAGPTVSALAGTSGMSPRTFGALATPGLVLRCILVLRFAEYAREYIEVVRAWIDDYWVPGTVVMVILVLLYRWKRPAVPIRLED